ncbi:MAG TPA: type III secretion system stator protein SctL [Oligoflexia bacterium]|nr:type III secretion system stator protein SctL [Oligoflexia bacterium]
MDGQKKEGGSGLASALSEAQSVIEAAQKRAKEVLADAEKKYNEARELGHREGFEEGLREVSRTAVRLIEETTVIGERLAEEAAKLAMAIAATVINEHIKLDPDAAKNIAVRALQESVIGDSVTLVVNPEDEAVMQSAMSQIRRITGNAPVNIETDPSFSRGGCMVRTDFGEIDARIETLLESIRERLGLIGDGEQFRF